MSTGLDDRSTFARVDLAAEPREGRPAEDTIDPYPAGALLDRLKHHVHILEMNGDSYRLKHSKRRQRGSRSADTPHNPSEG
jgi:hypothetical protein